MIHGGNLTYEPEDMRYAAKLVSPETYIIDSDPAVGTLLNKKGNRVWGLHSFYTSLLALPFVALFGAKGFWVLNVFCLAFILLLAFRHFGELNDPLTAGVISLIALLFSAIPSYVFWIHSEMLVFTATAAGTYYALRSKAWQGGLFLGLAIAIKPPVALLLLPFGVWQYARSKSWRTVLIFCASTAVLLVPQLGFNLWNFQSLTSLSDWISTDHITAWRVFALWAGPGQGLVFFYPVVLWCLLSNRWPAWLSLSILSCLAIMSVYSCLTKAFYSHEVGTRYSMYLFPVLLFLGGKWRGRRSELIAAAFVFLAGGALLLDPLGNVKNMQLFTKTFPSMRLNMDLGIPLYPGAFYQTTRRYARGVAFDYVDNQNRTRRDSVQIMIRRAERDSVIMKLYSDDPELSGNVRLKSGRESISASIEPGKITTLILPMARGKFTSLVFPDVADPEPLSTAVLTLQTPLAVRSGNGELEWQSSERFFNPRPSYLYLAGPRIVSLYPSSSWIIATIASEDLSQMNDQGEEPTLLWKPNSGNPGLGWTENDLLEGHRALEITAPDNDGIDDNVLIGSFRIGDNERLSDSLEIAAWYRGSMAEGQSPQVIAVIAAVFFGAQGELVSSVPLVSMKRSQGWTRLEQVVPIPNGGASVSLLVGFRNGAGKLVLDDIVISFYRGPWEW